MARTTPVNAGYTIVNGTATGSNGSKVDVWLEYKVISQSVADNTSTLHLLLYAAATFSSTTKREVAGNYGWVGYDNTNQRYLSATYDFGNYRVNCFGNATYTIAHESDGAKRVALQGGFRLNSSYISGGNVSSVVTLPAIARASALSIPASAAIGGNFTAAISAKNKNFSHRIKVSFGSKSQEQAVAAGAASAAVSIPAHFAEAVPSAVQGTGSVLLSTYSGGTLVGSVTLPITLTVPATMAPAVSALELTPMDSAVPAGWNVYIQGKSKVRSALRGATGAYGSTILGYHLEGGGASAGAAQMETPVYGAGKVTYTGYVTDSRGRKSNVVSAAIEVLPYENPKLKDVRMFRCDQTGAEADEGTYLCVRFTPEYSHCGGRNSAAVRLRYRPQGTNAWGSSGVLAGGQDHLLAGFSAALSYDLQLEITDAFATGSYSGILHTAERIVNIRSDGRGIAFGKMSEKQGFEFAGPVYFDRAPMVGERTAATVDATNALSVRRLDAQSIELAAATPYIDFHYNDSKEDYTARMIADAANRLRITSNLSVQGAITMPQDQYFYHGTAMKSSGSKQVLDILGDTGVRVANSGWTGYAPIYASAFTVSSSQKYKHDIRDAAQEEIAKILHARVRSFIYNDNTTNDPSVLERKRSSAAKKGLKEGAAEREIALAEEEKPRQLGFIVEELEQAGITYPIVYRDGVPDGLDYSKLVPYLVGLCQAQQRAIDRLEHAMNAHGLLAEEKGSA